jgi:hypothetical protein
VPEPRDTSGATPRSVASRSTARGEFRSRRGSPDARCRGSRSGERDSEELWNERGTADQAARGRDRAATSRSQNGLDARFPPCQLTDFFESRPLPN